MRVDDRSPQKTKRPPTSATERIGSFSGTLDLKVDYYLEVIRPGLPHYVTQRGRTRDCSVFREATDYRVFLHLLEESCLRNKVAIWGYTLLSGGYSLILVPPHSDSLHLAMRRLDKEYARYHNLRHMVRGPVWEGPARPVAMCWSEVWDALVHVERQAIREEGLSAAWAHPWSSAACRLGRCAKPGFLDTREWARYWTSEQWMGRLQKFQNEAQFEDKLGAASVGGGSLGEVLSGFENSTDRIGPHRAGTRKELRVISAAG